MTAPPRSWYLVVFACGFPLSIGCDGTRGIDSASQSSNSVGEAQIDSSEPLIGRPPPPIRVAKWIKGEPLTEFEAGKIYVVDLWATWCGPCIAAIPHLTELAHEHEGKVEVIGISIAERQKNRADTAYIEMVTKFVEKKGDRMDYRVAVDTPDKQMYRNWFQAAGTGGIPTAVVIDQNGLVAWAGIGNPSAIDRVVRELLEAKPESAKDTEAQN